MTNLSVMDLLLTPRELAERWQMSEKTLANHRSGGMGIPYVKLGSAVRYHLSDVIAFEKRVVAGHGS